MMVRESECVAIKRRSAEHVVKLLANKKIGSAIGIFLQENMGNS